MTALMTDNRKDPLEILQRMQDDVALLKLYAADINRELGSLARSDAHRLRRFAEISSRLDRIEALLDEQPQAVVRDGSREPDSSWLTRPTNDG